MFVCELLTRPSLSRPTGTWAKSIALQVSGIGNWPSGARYRTFVRQPNTVSASPPSPVKKWR